MPSHVLVSALLLAVPLPSAGGSVDWLGMFTDNLATLTSQNGGALSQLGSVLLSFVSLMVLINMVIRWSASGMSLHLHRQPVRAGDLTHFLLRLIFCSLLETYWVNPLPGTSFGLNHLFSYCAAQIVQVLDQNSLDTLLTLLRHAGENTAQPSITAPREILCYFVVQVILGLASAILFLINVSGFILYGVCALFGPIFIPLYMTKTFRGKFLNFVDVLLSLAMIRAVAAAFIFVWAGFMNGFIQQTFNDNYSMDMWLTNLIPCIMVFIAFILNMLFIPSITQMIFGGGAGMAGKVESVGMKLAGIEG